jgi:hypothetical protein
MKVLEFRKIFTSDIHDQMFNDGYAWSRIYEYPLVIRHIEKYYKPDDTIHNSSWGFEGVHIVFKEQLDKNFNVQHSDIRPSSLKNTFVYDITKRDSNLKQKYDFVVNISTLEEVNSDHIEVFNNLFDQVKMNGYFIATFDLPGLQLERFEEFFGKKIEQDNIPLNGNNSVLKNNNCANLNVGLMVLKKE